MALVLRNGGSIDTAIRRVAEGGFAESSPMFSKVVHDADTRLCPDMRGSVSRMLSDVPEGASSYAMAVRMMMSASDARNTEERDRLME